MDNQDLIKFLVKAKKSSYASGDSNSVIILDDGSKEIHFKARDFFYRDRFFGGEPFSGQEVVFFKNKPVWVMNYFGRVSQKYHNKISDIYGFLQNALRQVGPDTPFRGPESFTGDSYLYKNNWNGGYEYFKGKEEIFIDKVKVYEAFYHGGYVDK